MAGFDPITAALNLGNSLIDRLIPDATANAKAKADLVTMQVQGEFAVLAAQLDINKAEAANTNWFVAGWRPFAGWIGGFALAYASVAEPLMRFVAATVFGYTGQFPVLDTTITMQVLMGMLGLGAARTIEKLKDAESNR